MKNRLVRIMLIVAIIFISFFAGQYYGVPSQPLETGQQSENSALRIYKVGEGYILSDKEGINNETEGIRVYKNGEDVFLTSSPSDGYYFYSWTGCDGVYTFNNMCWVAMNESKTVTAVFEQAEKTNNQ